LASALRMAQRMPVPCGYRSLWLPRICWQQREGRAAKRSAVHPDRNRLRQVKLPRYLKIAARLLHEFGSLIPFELANKSGTEIEAACVTIEVRISRISRLA
jgi:hypothetical protein